MAGKKRGPYDDIVDFPHNNAWLRQLEGQLVRVKSPESQKYLSFGCFDNCHGGWNGMERGAFDHGLKQADVFRLRNIGIGFQLEPIATRKPLIINEEFGRLRIGRDHHQYDRLLLEGWAPIWIGHEFVVKNASVGSDDGIYRIELPLFALSTNGWARNERIQDGEKNFRADMGVTAPGSVTGTNLIPYEFYLAQNFKVRERVEEWRMFGWKPNTYFIIESLIPPKAAEFLATTEGKITCCQGIDTKLNRAYCKEYMVNYDTSDIARLVTVNVDWFKNATLCDPYMQELWDLNRVERRDPRFACFAGQDMIRSDPIISKTGMLPGCLMTCNMPAAFKTDDMREQRKGSCGPKCLALFEIKNNSAAIENLRADCKIEENTGSSSGPIVPRPTPTPTPSYDPASSSSSSSSTSASSYPPFKSFFSSDKTKALVIAGTATLTIGAIGYYFTQQRKKKNGNGNT